MMKDLTARLATLDECQAVADLVNAAYSEWIPVLGREPAPMLADYRELIERGVVYTLHNEDRLAGVLVIWPIEDAMLIENIAIHPEYQRKGIGRILMDYAEQKAREVGLKMMRLYTNEKMIYNQEYYRKLGYVETRRIVTDKGHHIVWMHKVLV